MSSEEMSTHYSVLHCDEKASKQEIRKQYKKLALMTHPDKTESMTSCEDFHRIDRAVKVLDNDLSRRQYDCQLIDNRSDNCIINEELSISDLTLNCDMYSYGCRCGGSYESYPITSLHKVSPCDEGYVYIPIVFMSMLYIVYLVECWHCNTRFELIYALNASAVYTHIQQMREAQPIIWWKAVSYHYVRRSRQVTRYRNGDAYTTAQIYYERINSHVTGSCFSYGGCGVKDISKKLLDLELHPVTKIRFSKGFAFANIESANEFEEQRSNFFEDNERYDDYLEMREGLDLVGANFQEYMVIKLFGEHYSGSSNDLSRLSRDTTIDSIELINNYTMAPSYSEAVLQERYPLRTDNSLNIGNEFNSNQFNSDKSNDTLINRTTNRLRTSLSRTSLRNGQILYFVSPISNDSQNTVFRRLSLINSDNVTNADTVDNPPTYEEVLLESHSSRPQTHVFTLNPLRRSVTDRDFFRRLSNHFRFAFANIESANEFEEQRSNFFEDNERYDDYLEMREGLDLVGANFQEYMVIKLFGEHYSGSSNDLSRLSRDTTIDSIELINNYTMAPSYSEAVLQERYPLRTDNSLNIGNEFNSNQFNSDKSNDTLINRTTNRLRTSLSRTSLRNGQILYFVSPISNDSQNTVFRRLSLINSDNVTNADTVDNPPTYEEVLLESHSSRPQTHVFTLNPLRRSVTDRDFFRRLSNHFRRQWNSYHDIQVNANETQL
ncbi:unnamed protein product [Oppiella nova]|uniref:J domain-containing protein n=1 Tax=Oppiella nova TaxID=334625 RepID=A0A7R9L9A7_9ACAR|nr:unnamed protein product [Oppiella nova]CAG2160534.1 unnamed protein product [Oppiella nova]